MTDAAEVSMLRDAVRAQDQFIAEQNAALRQLLAYCEAEAVDHARFSDSVAVACFEDVAGRLRAILDNVTGVERQVDPRTGLDL